MSDDADWEMLRTSVVDELQAIALDDSLDADERDDRVKGVQVRITEYLRKRGYEL